MNKRDWVQLLALMLAALIGLTAGLLVPKDNTDREDTLQRLSRDAVAVFSHEGQTSLPFSIAPLSTEDVPAAQTSVPVEELTQEIGEASAFSIVPLGKASLPEYGRILLYHTHTYEAYEKGQQPYQETERWRTADANYNMVRVGEELAQLLRGLGYTVVHDTTAFEPPDLSSAYIRSLDMLEKRKKAGEEYDLYIDLHRDAYVDGQVGANTVTAGGVEVSRLMLLIGKGEGYTDAGYDQKPDWEANLACAQGITDALNGQAPDICKDVRLKSGRFNQHVAQNCVLIEVGNNRNTLQQALAAMPYLADAIHAVLCP